MYIYTPIRIPVAIAREVTRVAGSGPYEEEDTCVSYEEEDTCSNCTGGNTSSWQWVRATTSAVCASADRRAISPIHSPASKIATCRPRTETEQHPESIM